MRGIKAMGKTIRLSEWPFEINEQVKLIWIGDPFRKDKKWMIKVYFRSLVKQQTKELIVDWPAIHFFCVGRIYANGIINKYSFEPGARIQAIDLRNSESYYNERVWKIQGSNHAAISRTFSFVKNKKLYLLPYVEFVRGVLAVNSFALRLILQLDGVEDYFTYEHEGEIFKMYFTNEYSKKLLTKENLYHLAWIFSNKSILTMFNQAFMKLVFDLKKGNKLSFLLERFELTARIRENGDKIFIQEITAVKNKEINAKQIIIEHPAFLKREVLKGAKKREFTTYGGNTANELKLDNQADGATRNPEIIESLQVKQEYVNIPGITQYGFRDNYIKTSSDTITKNYFSKNRGTRTLADVGGENTEQGIEFVEVDKIFVKGELEEFIEVIKLLEMKEGIKKIEVAVASLPFGNNNKFAFLSDSVTPRKYVIAKVIMKNGKERLIIDVERYGKNLSMLILKTNMSVKWDIISDMILEGLVRNSGSWNKRELIAITIREVEVIRKKHMLKSKIITVNDFYDTIIN